MTSTEWFVLLVPLVYGTFGVFATEYPKIKALADAALIGIIFSIVFIIYAEKIPSLGASTALLEDFSKDNILYKVFSNSSRVQAQVDQLSSDVTGRMFKEHFRKLFADLDRELENIKRKRIDVSETDAMDFAVSAFRSATKTIDATSYVMPTGWWIKPDGSLSSEGRYYLKQNMEVISKGIKIRRVFILNNDDEMKALKSALDGNVDAGVEVYTALLSDIPSSSRSDMLLVDQKLAGELKIDPISRIFSGFTATYDTDLVSDLGARIDVVIRKSSPYSKQRDPVR